MFDGNARNVRAYILLSAFYVFFFTPQTGELLQLAGHLFSNVFIFSARIVKRAGRSH